MKGFPTDTSLHAFMLEPRIVFDGDVAVTVAEVADSSTEASDSTTADNTTTPTVTEQTSSENSAPQLSTDQDTIGAVSASSQVIYDDTIFGHLTSNIDSLVVSADGKYAYAVSYTNSVVTVFSIAEDGSIDLAQNLHSSDLAEALTDGLSGVSLVQFSADQSHVYVYSETNQSLLTFARDSDSGELSYVSQTDLSGTLNGQMIDSLQENNGYLYASVGSSIYAFQSNDDGATFVLTDTETNGENGVQGISDNTSLTFSADGSLLFASSSNGDGEVLSIFSVDDGLLTYVGSVSGADSNYIHSIVVSEDASRIYLLNYNGDEREVLTISKESSTADGPHYSLLSTDSVSSDVTQLVLSQDGSTLFTFGTSVMAYTLNSDGTLNSGTTMDSSAATLRGGINSVAYASQSGDIMTITADAISVYRYQTADSNYTEGDDAVAIVANGLISDSELDQLDDYNGATISISRAEAVENSGDSYTLLAQNGLTLDGSDLLLDGDVIGVWNASDSGVSVTFTDSVSQATAQSVLRQIAYANTSDDPDAAGASVSLNITVNDGDGAETTMSVTLNINDVNDAPVVTGSDSETDYTSGDEYVPLFTDVVIDTIEADQNIWKATIAISGASNTDVLNVDGSIITLTSFSGARTTENGLTYQVMNSADGGKTVVLFLNKDVQTSSELINSISYRTTTLSSEGSVSFNLKVTELDATISETSVDATVHVTAQTADNQAAAISGGGDSVSYSEKSGEQDLFSGVTVADTEMDARNQGLGNYAGSVITVTLDGDDSQGVLSVASDETYTYQSKQILKDGVVIATVENSGSGLTITFTEAYKTIPTTADVNHVLSLIQYTNDSSVLPESTDVSLTVTDSFGLISEALVTTLDFIAVNDAPITSLGDLYTYGLLDTITSSAQLDQLTDIAGSVISESGNRLFVADSEGLVAVYAVDGSSGQLSHLYTLTRDSAAETLVTNAEGSQLFVVTSKLDEYNSTYSEVTVYTVDDQGTLTEQQVIAMTAMDFGFYSAVNNFTLSGDGSYLFFTSSYSLYSYQVDSSSGELTNMATYSNAWSEPYIYQVTALAVSGDYLFVTTKFSSATLIAYQISDSGLNWVSYIRNGNTDANGVQVSVGTDIIDLEASADGKTLYAVTGSGITHYQFDPDGNAFSAAGSTELDNIVDSALSADGSILYVTTTDGHLNRYTTEGGTLTLIDSIALSSDNASLQVTSDGHVLVGEKDFTYLGSSSYQPSIETAGSVALMPTVVVSDADYAADDFYRGFSFTLTSSGGSLSADNITLDADSGFALSEGVITYNGEDVATQAFTDGQWVINVTGNITQNTLNSLLQAVQFHVGTESIAGDTIAFTLTTTDSEGAENSNSWVMQVVAAPEPPQVSFDQSEMSAEQGEAFLYQFDEQSVTDPQGLALTWQISGLPDGVSFDSDSQTLSGTPLQSGDYSVTVTVQNSRGLSSEFSFVLSVSDASEPATPVEPEVPTQPETPTEPVTPTQPENPSPGEDERFSHIHDFSADADPAPRANTGQGTMTDWQSLMTETSTSQARYADTSQLFNVALDSFANTEQWWQELQRDILTETSETQQAVQISLLSLAELSGMKVLAVTAGNGQPLPDGVSFDAQTGILNLDSGAAEAHSALIITVTTEDGEGNVQQIRVPLHQDSGGEQPETMTLNQQTKQVSQQALTAERQQILAELR